jgi:hypothetical protein
MCGTMKTSEDCWTLSTRASCNPTMSHFGKIKLARKDFVSGRETFVLRRENPMFRNDHQRPPVGNRRKQSGAANEQVRSSDKACSDNCACAVFRSQLIREEIATERARAASAEAAQWEACFGATSPVDRGAKQQRIVQVASGRAFLALLSKPNTQPPSFDDFFPDET